MSVAREWWLPLPYTKTNIYSFKFCTSRLRCIGVELCVAYSSLRCVSNKYKLQKNHLRPSFSLKVRSFGP